MTDFVEILERCNAMLKAQEPRVKMQDALQDVFALNWDEKFLTNKPAWVQETRDPTPFNAIQAMVDVLSVNEPSPTIEVPRQNVDNGPLIQPDALGLMTPIPANVNSQDPEKLGEILEGVARVVLKHNDERREFSLQRDILYSAFIFGQSVVKVADLRLSGLWKPTSRISLYGKSPFAIKALRPQYVYYDFDELGLCAVLQREVRSIRALKRLYADTLKNSTITADADGNVIYSEWWTRDEHCCWIEKNIPYNTAIQGNVENSLILEDVSENTLGFVPYVIRSARGTSIFEKDNLFPTLYSGWKSKMFYRSNLFLTVAASLAFAMANPQFVHKSATGDKTFKIDFSGPNVWNIAPDESLEQLKTALPGDLYQMLQVITDKVQQSSISPVLTGSPPGGVTAASGINLLIQGGKLTIFPIQMAVQETYAEITQMVFDYVKAYADFSEETQLQLFLSNNETTLTPDMIPQYLNISYELKADLPQDKIAMVQAALAALGKIISKETAWDWIGIEDKPREQARMDADMAEQQMMMQQQSQLQQPTSDQTQNQTMGLPPEMASGMPPDQNPQAPPLDVGTMASVLQNAGQPPQGA
jgi:hypothetical protein